MVTKSKLAGYTVYTNGDDQFFTTMLDDFLHSRLTTLKVFRSIPDTKVSLVEKDGKLYVLKVFTPKEKRNERFLKSFFRGDYYLTLFKQTAMLRERDVTFPNDFYLLAETKIFNFASRFIMIIEYIPGVEMDILAQKGELTEKIKSEVLESVKVLHKNRVIFDDAHKQNFMLSKGQVRVIDLSGKNYSRFRAAKDFIDLERHFGISDFHRGFSYQWVKRKSQFRKKFKAFKGRLIGRSA